MGLRAASGDEQVLTRRGLAVHLLAELDVGDGHSDLARDEDLAAPGGLVVEQDPVAAEHVVRLPASCGQ